MRTFSDPIDSTLYDQIWSAAVALYEAAPKKRQLTAGMFAMDGDADRMVATEADIAWDTGRLRIAQTVPEARPPFEWLLEITSDVDEQDYFKHYLVREHDVVLAQRKVLTVIDATEAQIILHDLAEAQAALDQG